MVHLVCHLVRRAVHRRYGVPTLSADLPVSCDPSSCCKAPPRPSLHASRCLPALRPLAASPRTRQSCASPSAPWVQPRGDPLTGSRGAAARTAVPRFGCCVAAVPQAPGRHGTLCLNGDGICHRVAVCRRVVCCGVPLGPSRSAATMLDASSTTLSVSLHLAPRPPLSGLRCCGPALPAVVEAPGRNVGASSPVPRPPLVKRRAVHRRSPSAAAASNAASADMLSDFVRYLP